MAAIDEMAVREAALRFLEDRTEFGTRTVTQPEVATAAAPRRRPR